MRACSRGFRDGSYIYTLGSNLAATWLTLPNTRCVESGDLGAHHCYLICRFTSQPLHSGSSLSRTRREFWP